MPTFKDEIHAYLTKNNMSQTDLARTLGISKQYLNQYLTGRRDAVYLEIKIRAIINGD